MAMAYDGAISLCIFKKWMVVFFLIVAVGLTGCGDEGVLATPAINPHPKEIVQIGVRVLHIPDYDFKSAPEETLIARWESNVRACSVIRHGYGGSWITPKYEIKLKRNSNGEFSFYSDLIAADKCDWRLTGVIYSYDDGGEKLAGFGLATEQLLRKKHWLFSCEFGKPGETITYPSGLVIDRAGGLCLVPGPPQVQLSPSFNSLFEISKEN